VVPLHSILILLTAVRALRTSRIWIVSAISLNVFLLLHFPPSPQVRLFTELKGMF